MSCHEELGWFSTYLTRMPGFPWVTVLDRTARIPQISRYLTGRKKQRGGIRASLRRLLPHSAEAWRIWSRYYGERFVWDYLIDQCPTEAESQRVRKLVKTVLRLQGRRRFFSKLTGPPRITYLSATFPDAYYIHVLRDPRAVVSSLLEVRFWRQKGGFEGPWWQNGLSETYVQQWVASERSPVALAALQWKRIIELAWDERKQVGADRYLEVRYEDFADTPHRVLSDILVGTGLADSRSVHQYLARMDGVVNMNFKFRRSLSPKDIHLIERLTGDAAARAGYHFSD
jgi:DNA-binding transcriptional regulator YdaS (Cro superfamily)